MFPAAREVRLEPERRGLPRLGRAPMTEQRQLLQARIVLLACKGHSARAMRELGVMPLGR